MGREIRMVPPNWEHPKVIRRNGELDYQPMYDQDAESAWSEWLASFETWRIKHPNDPNHYRSFCDDYGRPPNPEYYRPAWPEGSATWVQVYATVSEGTPVTPPFATCEELIEYLVENGDFWDQRRRRDGARIPCGPWERNNAESFVNAGYAPSLMVTNNEGSVEIKQPRDGI